MITKIITNKLHFVTGFSGLCALLISLALAINLAGCTSPSGSDPFQTRIFEGNYDQIWMTVLKALNDYPIKVSNKDAGKVHTETVNGPYNELLFTYPDPLELPERFRYAMKFSLGKLEGSDGGPFIRVRVVKELERFQDFYAGWVSYPSDGLEEKILLYRIEHLLKMEAALSKSQP